MSTYSDAIKEAFAVAPADKVIFHTLEIRQEGVQNPIYLVRSRKELSARDENGVLRTFEPSGFRFSLPPASEEGFQSLNLSIDNVGRRINGFINTAKTSKVPVKIVYRPYLSDDLSTPQMSPPLVLFLRDVSVSTVEVTGKAAFMDLVNLPFPSQLYTRTRFPSLG